MKQKIFFIALSVMAIFIIYFGLESLNPSLVNVSAEKNINPLEKDPIKILDEIKDKTYKEYNINTYKISSNEIDIEIKGSQEYYDSIKNEIKVLVKNTTKSTAFENYSININKSEINQIISEERKEEHRLIHEILATTHDFLSESYPNQIDQINLDYPIPELHVNVNTLLNEKQLDVGKEMESKIYMDLEKKLFLNKFVKNQSVKIHIYNKHGEKIN